MVLACPRVVTSSTRLTASAVRRQPFVRPLRRSSIERAGTDEPIVIVLFDHVGAPAGHAGGGKDRRVQRGIEAEHGEDRRGVKIDVRAEMLLAFHRGLEIFTNRYPLLLAHAFAEI